MPPADFYECMAYDQMEPFGDMRGDLQAGIIASTIANFAGKISKKEVNPSDFMPFLVKPQEPVTNTMESAEALHAKFVMFKQGYERFLAKKKSS